jgi:hypothetical protein
MENRDEFAEESENRVEFSDADKKQTIDLVVGMKRMGKSSLIKMELLKDKKKVIIMDPRNEYASAHAVLMESLEELAKYIEDKKVFRVRFINTDVFEELCAFVYEYGDLTFVLEETPAYLPSSQSSLEGGISDIVFRGAHRRVNLITSAQRLSMVNINLRSQLDNFYTFKQFEQRDVDIACQMTRLEPEEIYSLNVAEYYKRSPECEVTKHVVEKLKKLIDK